jgi:hypothetical protein
MKKWPWIAVFCLSFCVACVSPTPPQDTLAEQEILGEGLVPLTDGSGGTRAPLYGCFDAATALRVLPLQNGALSTWETRKFRHGFCLALPKGTKIERQQTVRYGERKLRRVLLPEAKTWLYVPVLSNSQSNALRSLLPISKELQDYAYLHIACMREVLDLNSRVLAHNELFLEENQERRGEETITKTVIKLNPTQLDIKGRVLNREIADYQARCSDYRTLEAAADFISFLRERAGIEGLPEPRLEKATG